MPEERVKPVRQANVTKVPNLDNEKLRGGRAAIRPNLQAQTGKRAPVKPKTTARKGKSGK